ncbi:MAG TPA: T9SS type A sorting domain-containing protein [Bacteroidales bacterium]|nr:T9SS type A sorting domain-containing protein [Bacteroidales bacterium]
MKSKLFSLRRRLKIIIVASLYIHTSFAATYYVSPSGSDSGDGSAESPFATISKAATIVIPGDTILVNGGSYFEKNIIPASSGTENAMIVFKTNPGTGVVTISHPAVSLDDNTPIFDLSNKSYIWIEGFQFEDFEYGKASVFITNGKGNVVINNKFINIGNSQVASWNGNSVVWVYNASGNIIRNNYFNNITGDGISINGQSAVYNLVCDNTFDTFKGKLRSWGGEYLFSRAIDIQDMSNGNNVVAFNYAAGVVNHIWLDRDGSNNVILRNVAHNSAGLVFNESRCAFNVIQENIGYNLTGAAFQTARYETTGWTLDARWINNVAYNNQIGFYVDMSERNEFRNNISFNNIDYNMVFTNKSFDNGPHIFRNNLWYSADKMNSILLRNNNVSVSQFQSAVGETNGLSTDPLFVNTNPGSEDFSLQQSSPAIHAGDMVVDLGAYAVYQKTTVGWDPDLQISKALVYFDTLISSAKRGEQVRLGIRLSKPVSEQISVDVVPVAGDARIDKDFQFINQTVVFEPGETSKSVLISVIGDSDFDELVAFRFANLVNAQDGSRNIRLLRIQRIPKLTANAGEDQVVKVVDKNTAATVLLDGSESDDPDGTIDSYVWKEDSIQIATGVNPSVNLPFGYHTITLTISDNEGNTDTDEVNINVVVDSDVWLEAECGIAGSLWNIETDNNASNEQYVTIQPGNNSTDAAPADDKGLLSLTFDISQGGDYSLWARVICPDPNSDSFWLKMDDGSYVMWNNLTSSSNWVWVNFSSMYNLLAGNHTLTIAYREDGAKLDKVLISNSGITPTKSGSAANNCGNVKAVPGEYTENITVYPNPVTEAAHIMLSGLPSDVTVYNINGQKLLSLRAKSTNVILNMTEYMPGVYFVKIVSREETFVKKIIKK